MQMLLLAQHTNHPLNCAPCVREPLDLLFISPPTAGDSVHASRIARERKRKIRIGAAKKAEHPRSRCAVCLLVRPSVTGGEALDAEQRPGVLQAGVATV